VSEADEESARSRAAAEGEARTSDKAISDATVDGVVVTGAAVGGPAISDAAVRGVVVTGSGVDDAAVGGAAVRGAVEREAVSRDGRRTSGPDPHRAREVAESFGADAQRYDRARPRYPVALLERVLRAASRPGVGEVGGRAGSGAFVVGRDAEVGELGEGYVAGTGVDVLDGEHVARTGAGIDVLDVGCGTGIVARQLLAFGCRVLGVDVDARMVELARRSGVEAEVAAFEGWDAAGRMFDVVVSGQAWHWLDPYAAVARAADVLRPGGRLAVFWNVFQPAPDVAAAFDEVYHRVLPELTGFSWARSAIDGYAPILNKTSEAVRADDGFGEPEEWRFTWEHVYSRDAWLDQVPTFGNSNVMPPEKLAALVDGLGVVIDQLGGQFTMPYTTVAITAARAAARLG